MPGGERGLKLVWRPSPVGLQSANIIGPPVVPFFPFWGEGSPTKIDYSKKKTGTLFLSSLLEDPDKSLARPLFRGPSTREVTWWLHKGLPLKTH